jgi:Kef-type K+ transport system membrane component KefB
VVLIVLLLCVLAAGWMGGFAVLGAFLLGASIAGYEALRGAASRRMRAFAEAFFLPIFFACTGLRTDIGTLAAWGSGLLGRRWR